jgi:beta-galactosidase
VTSVVGQSAPLFGGDYNPEQWPDSRRDADLAALEQLGVNTVTLGVFSWALLQPAKNTFELGWLERVVDAVVGREIGVVLATPTAAQPAWMSAAFPEILPVDPWGRRRRHGGRVNYCPSSTAYREAAAEIAGVLADRFGGHDALRLWHVNNEYGPVCYCDHCFDDFRRWLTERYGDLTTLNEAWGTAVWGNTIYDWSEIELPSELNAMDEPRPGRVRLSPNPSIALDHARYCSSVLLDCFLNEKAVLRDRTPTVPVTTNFHGPVQVVDWHEWSEHVDLVSWDSYPRSGGHWAHPAFGHALARGSGQHADFLVMEASPGPVNWHELGALKRPGRVRLEAVQAVAHGSRGMLYFQIRQARGGAELSHAAMIPRHGRLDTRTGAELLRLSADLRAIGVVVDGRRFDATIALVFDWPSWWGHHNTPGLDQRSRYLETVRETYRALCAGGCAVDVLGCEGPFSGYDAVVAPLLHVAGHSTISALARFVGDGGLLVTTCGSAVVGDDCQVHPDGVDPVWRDLVGLWVEETDVQPAGVVNQVVFLDDDEAFGARELFDIVRLESAVTLAEFRDDFYAGSPAVTLNRFGAGRAMYVASPTADLVAAALVRALDRRGTDGADVERLTWTSDDDEIVFVLNHGEHDTTVALAGGTWIDVLTGRTHRQTTSVPAADAVVLRRSR